MICNCICLYEMLCCLVLGLSLKMKNITCLHIRTYKNEITVNSPLLESINDALLRGYKVFPFRKKCRECGELTAKNKASIKVQFVLSGCDH